MSRGETRRLRAAVVAEVVAEVAAEVAAVVLEDVVAVVADAGDWQMPQARRQLVVIHGRLAPHSPILAQ